MILGIDLHGVIDSDIESFKSMLECQPNIGDKLYIISGPPKVDIERELNEYGLYRDIHFDEVFSVVDFLKETNVKMWLDKNGRWWASEEDWWSSKAKICEKYNVDTMIDNEKKYQQYFKEKKIEFILYIT